MVSHRSQSNGTHLLGQCRFIVLIDRFILPLTVLPSLWFSTSPLSFCLHIVAQFTFDTKCTLAVDNTSRLSQFSWYNTEDFLNICVCNLKESIAPVRYICPHFKILQQQVVDKSHKSLVRARGADLREEESDMWRWRTLQRVIAFAWRISVNPYSVLDQSERSFLSLVTRWCSTSRASGRF